MKIICTRTIGYDGEEGICINQCAIREGVIKEIGDEQFLMLLAIESFINTDNNCPATYRQLADILVWNKSKVKDVMYRLQHTEFKDGKLISNNIIDEIRRNSEQEDAQQTTCEVTPRDILIYWNRKYKETYFKTYNVNWGRDTAMVKRLLSKFSGDMLFKAIDVVFKYYKVLWSTPQYPTPTIGAFCTWLINQAIAKVQEIERQEAKIMTKEEIDRLNAIAEAYFDSP